MKDLALKWLIRESDLTLEVSRHNVKAAAPSFKKDLFTSRQGGEGGSELIKKSCTLLRYVEWRRGLSSVFLFFCLIDDFNVIRII